MNSCRLTTFFIEHQVFLGSIKNLQSRYHIYAIDTIGQATRSVESTLDFIDDSYPRSEDEVLNELNLERANFIGIS